MKEGDGGMKCLAILNDAGLVLCLGDVCCVIDAFKALKCVRNQPT